ncbi:hypothetical protein DIPPA_27997 [Diplonema papillatum]|nr:hypothetical protein DIPPA_27997 [Diplonema papillatum]
MPLPLCSGGCGGNLIYSSYLERKGDALWANGVWSCSHCARRDTGERWACKKCGINVCFSCRRRDGTRPAVRTDDWTLASQPARTGPEQCPRCQNSPHWARGQQHNGDDAFEAQRGPFRMPNDSVAGHHLKAGHPASWPGSPADAIAGLSIEQQQALLLLLQRAQPGTPRAQHAAVENSTLSNSSSRANANVTTPAHDFGKQQPHDKDALHTAETPRPESPSWLKTSQPVTLHLSTTPPSPSVSTSRSGMAKKKISFADEALDSERTHADQQQKRATTSTEAVLPKHEGRPPLVAGSAEFIEKTSPQPVSPVGVSARVVEGKDTTPLPAESVPAQQQAAATPPFCDATSAEPTPQAQRSKEIPSSGKYENTRTESPQATPLSILNVDPRQQANEFGGSLPGPSPAAAPENEGSEHGATVSNPDTNASQVLPTAERAKRKQSVMSVPSSTDSDTKDKDLLSNQTGRESTLEFTQPQLKKSTPLQDPDTCSSDAGEAKEDRTFPEEEAKEDRTFPEEEANVQGAELVPDDADYDDTDERHSGTARRIDLTKLTDNDSTDNATSAGIPRQAADTQQGESKPQSAQSAPGTQLSVLREPSYSSASSADTESEGEGDYEDDYDNQDDSDNSSQDGREASRARGDATTGQAEQRPNFQRHEDEAVSETNRSARRSDASGSDSFAPKALAYRNPVTGAADMQKYSPDTIALTSHAARSSRLEDDDPAEAPPLRLVPTDFLHTSSEQQEASVLTEPGPSHLNMSKISATPATSDDDADATIASLASTDERPKGPKTGAALAPRLAPDSPPAINMESPDEKTLLDSRDTKQHTPLKLSGGGTYDDDDFSDISDSGTETGDHYATEQLAKEEEAQRMAICLAETSGYSVLGGELRRENEHIQGERRNLRMREWLESEEEMTRSSIQCSEEVGRQSVESDLKLARETALRNKQEDEYFKELSQKNASRRSSEQERSLSAAPVSLTSTEDLLKQQEAAFRKTSAFVSLSETGGDSEEEDDYEDEIDEMDDNEDS